MTLAYMNGEYGRVVIDVDVSKSRSVDVDDVTIAAAICRAAWIDNGRLIATVLYWISKKQELSWSVCIT